MRRWYPFTVAALIVLACLLYQIYPSSSILGSNYYDVVSSPYGEEFVLTINPQDYAANENLKQNKTVDIDAPVAERFDTKILFHQLTFDNQYQRVDVTIINETKWRLFQGHCLTVMKADHQGIPQGFTTTVKRFMVTDESGKQILCQLGEGPGEIMGVDLPKAAFFNARRIIIRFSGYNLTGYKLNLMPRLRRMEPEAPLAFTYLHMINPSTGWALVNIHRF